MADPWSEGAERFSTAPTWAPLIELLADHQFGRTSEIKSAVIFGNLSRWPVWPGFYDAFRGSLQENVNKGPPMQYKSRYSRETRKISGAPNERRLPDAVEVTTGREASGLRLDITTFPGRVQTRVQTSSSLCFIDLLRFWEPEEKKPIYNECVKGWKPQLLL